MDAVGTRPPDARGTLVRDESLERTVVDVHTRVPVQELLVSEIATAGDHDVREQPAIAVARGLGRVADEGGAAAGREPACERGCSRGVALADLGRVDADEANTLVAPVAEADMHGVAVDDPRDDAVQREGARACSSRGRRERSREDDHGRRGEELPHSRSQRRSDRPWLQRARRLPGMQRDEFWEFERAGWERAAPRYEECWSDTGLYLEPLLDAAGVVAGSRLLDLACGPGYVSEAAAARGADPVGLDVAAAMLERARLRCPGLTFVEGDAQQLPFDDASFEAVTMNFGILHLSQPERAIAEARRVLVPGGSFAFTAWVEEGNAVAEIVDTAVARHALSVPLPKGPPFYRFADADESGRVLREAGFDRESVRVETVTALWRTPSAALLFEAELRAGVRTAAVLAAQPPDRLEAIGAAITEGVRRYPDGDGFALPTVARLISAQAPDEARRAS